MLVADVPMLKDRINRRIKELLERECTRIKAEMGGKVVVNGIDVDFRDALYVNQPIDSFVSDIDCSLIIDGVQF